MSHTFNFVKRQLNLFFCRDINSVRKRYRVVKKQIDKITSGRFVEANY